MPRDDWYEVIGLTEGTWTVHAVIDHGPKAAKEDAAIHTGSVTFVWISDVDML